MGIYAGSGNKLASGLIWRECFHFRCKIQISHSIPYYDLEAEKTFSTPVQQVPKERTAVLCDKHFPYTRGGPKRGHIVGHFLSPGIWAVAPFYSISICPFEYPAIFHISENGATVNSQLRMSDLHY